MMSKQMALKLMIGLIAIVILFHLLVLFEIISYEIVWAGRINSIEEMRMFEGVSIGINSLLLLVLGLKFQNLKNNTSKKVIDIIIWIFVFVFALNTIGNLFAETWIELILGTLLTLISSVLCWIIVRKEKGSSI